VRPDVPVAAIDRAVFEAPVWTGELLVGSAHTDHAAGRWGYAVTANVGMEPRPNTTRVAFADLGGDCPASESIALYDWRMSSVAVRPRDAGYDVALDPAGWDYRVLAPVLANGIAVIGDPAVYATAGDTRLGEVAIDGDEATVTVLGAGERVCVVGWSAGRIVARAWAPHAGAQPITATRDAATGRWELAVDVPASGWVRLHVAPEPA
jgi:hypothetical protein